MQRDLRETALYAEAYAIHESIRRPGSGEISEAAEVQLSPDGRYAVFTGTIAEKLEGALATRICRTELASGETQVVTVGPGMDRLPKYSPDGRYLAFLSDRHTPGDFQLQLIDVASDAARSIAQLTGWVEYLHWSPGGQRILLGVTDYGADVSSGQGAIATRRVATDLPSWMPDIEEGQDEQGWRRAWVYELATGDMRPVGLAKFNVWEAVWCGDEAIAALVSQGPSESLWYSATLHLLDLKTQQNRELYKSEVQLGFLSASLSGRYAAIVEALASDRGYVAGDLKMIETKTARVVHVATDGVDITHIEWRSEDRLLLAGHRGFGSVVGTYDLRSDTFNELWCSSEISGTGGFISVAGCRVTTDCVVIGESFLRAPELAVMREGEYHVVKSFDLGYGARARSIARVEPLNWTAPDGLGIQGRLLRPRTAPPYPLILQIHGGPVWHWRPSALQGWKDIALLMLLERGYAVFLPNPRGSTGRGQDFSRRILGDMGGADTYDLLSGVDHLIARGLADPTRLGVTGVSYGGFMTSWLVTQDSRFAAAVSVAPVNNWVTEHLISNIPYWAASFLCDTYANTAGKYFQRSPIMYAHQAKTPTLNICGALDRSTPPEEGVQFHNALLENDTKSVLITYPEEGHGIRKCPASIDYAARTVAWFHEHLALSEPFSLDRA